MPIYLAEKTLKAIEEAFQRDQGARYRGLLKHLMPTAGDAYSTDESPFRKHLGASLIGRKCTRELWYVFHWAREVKHSGKMLRLFNRGHLEEPRMVALLHMILCKVWQFTEDGKQFRVSDDTGHFGGSLDSILQGCPDWPAPEILGEFKTHNDKSFTELEAKGVQSAKWEHFVQMQIYMKKRRLPGALYMATNKNTDQLYAELIPFQEDVADRYLSRAEHIIRVEQAPERLSNNPSWHECKFCDFRPICHGKDIPARNCRTCVYSKPIVEGEGKGAWLCRSTGEILTPVKQLEGCNEHLFNPEIKAPL